MVITSKYLLSILCIVRNFLNIVDIMQKVWYIETISCSFCIIYLQI